MTKIKSTFIGKFKIGDNIHYNLNVLKALYFLKEKLIDSDQVYLEKPITVTLVSICEALIFDFIDRSRNNVREGVTGLSESNLDKIRSSKTWNLDKKIELFKKLNLLKTTNHSVYDYLEKLAILRNRIHIQNEFNNFEADELDAFNKVRRIEAEKMVELLMKKIGQHYPRPPHIQRHQYVEDFELPWDAHFDEMIDS